MNNYDVVIFDRYIYDQIANIYSKSWLARLYGKILLEQTPAPDLAFIIDASPAAAFARKPEYPLEFLRSNREAYLALSRLSGDITIIEPLTVEAMSIKIREAFLQEPSRQKQQFSEMPALP